MTLIHPFKGIYPNATIANQVAVNSYDSYTKEEIKQITQNNELSFLNIIHKEPTTHRHDFYAMVRKKMQLFMKNEWLQKSPQNSLYIYKKITPTLTSTGVIALIDVRNISKGIVRLHEKTLAKRENILTDYLKEVKLNAEPVALIFEAQKEITSYLHKTTSKAAFVSFVDDHKNNHFLWEICEENAVKQLQNLYDTINYLLVADGHHRIMSSLKNFENNHNSPYFMSVLFDTNNVSIEPYQVGEKRYTFEEIKAITLTNKTLAPKSTWILPKLKTGLLIYDLKNDQ